jgi:hypothetical protein
MIATAAVGSRQPPCAALPPVPSRASSDIADVARERGGSRRMTVGARRPRLVNDPGGTNVRAPRSADGGLDGHCHITAYRVLMQRASGS